VRKLCAKYQQKTSINYDKMFWLLCFSIFKKSLWSGPRVFSGRRMQIRGEKNDDISYGFHSPPCSVVWCGKILRRFGDWVWLRVYFLPILTAEKGLDTVAIEALSQSALRQVTFVRDLPGSDGLHWGDGVIMANADQIWLDGEISPGPDYRLYLTPKYVETGSEFLQIKADSTQIGPIKVVVNFALDFPADVEASNFPAVPIWYEAFGQFITVARLQ
jgi:hypothetical protein